MFGPGFDSLQLHQLIPSIFDYQYVDGICFCQVAKKAAITLINYGKTSSVNTGYSNFINCVKYEFKKILLVEVDKEKALILYECGAMPGTFLSLNK